jgi:hypothetical protein
MNDHIFQTLVVIAILAILFYIIFPMNVLFKKREGLDTMSPSSSNSTNGEAGNSADYASTIKSHVIKLQDSLLISKYRKDYENAVINMEDFINYSMLKLMLNINTDSDKVEASLKHIEALNTLNQAKSSLNGIMKFIDSSH